VDDAPIGVLGGGNGTIVAFEFHGGPLDGSQTVVDPAGDDRLFARSIRVKATDELAGTVDDLGTDLWDDRLVLTPSDDGLDATPVPLVAHPRGSYVRIAPDEREALVEGAAYDVSMRLLDGSLRRLFSRAVLAQTDPETRRSDIRFGDREMELIGSVDVTASTREDPTVRLDPAEGFVTVGGEEREGTLRVLDDDGRERIRIDGETGDVHLALDGMGASPESLAERIQEVERRLEELEAE
jgi:hypothetical protein